MHWRKYNTNDNDNVIELAAVCSPAAPSGLRSAPGKRDCAPIQNADGTWPYSSRCQQTTRQPLATSPVPKGCRGFSFRQLLIDAATALAWLLYIALGIVCLMLPGFIFGWILFLA